MIGFFGASESFFVSLAPIEAGFTSFPRDGSEFNFAQLLSLFRNYGTIKVRPNFYCPIWFGYGAFFYPKMSYTFPLMYVTDGFSWTWVLSKK